ncbi:hypothetical protein J6590_079294 [Homalodisca vitripennis]|nr:hypothetical protein J6590_079294 [Homalodisca vitripennis]
MNRWPSEAILRQVVTVQSAMALTAITFLDWNISVERAFVGSLRRKSVYQSWWRRDRRTPRGSPRTDQTDATPVVRSAYSCPLTPLFRLWR